MMNVGVFENYGPLKVGHSYLVVSEEYDHYVLRCHGGNICTPKALINFNPNYVPKRQKQEEFDDDYDNYLEDFFMDGV